MKWIFRILLLLILLLVVAGIVIASKVDTLVTDAVETIAPEYTQSQVSLGGVNLALMSGGLSLSDLKVGNPAGFTSPNAFSLGEVSVGVELGSVMSDTIVVNSINIVAPQVTFEQTASGTNLQTLQSNIEKAIGPAGSPEPASESAKKLIIRDLKVTGGLISASSYLLPDKSFEVELPEIHLTGIGEKTDGATASEVTEILLTELTKQAKRAVAKSGTLGELKGQAKEQLEEKKQELKDKARDKLKDLF